MLVGACIAVFMTALWAALTRHSVECQCLGMCPNANVWCNE